MKVSNLSEDNFKKYSTSTGRHLSPQCGQVILVSGYPALIHNIKLIYCNATNQQLFLRSSSRTNRVDGLQLRGHEKMIWSLILCNFVTTIVANEENSRSANFIIRQNKRLASQAMLKIHPSSLVSCNQACLRHSWCTSTNFKESFGENSKGSCELNKHELPTIQHDAKLTDQPGNTFTMILEVGEKVSFKSNLNTVIFFFFFHFAEREII